MATVSLPVTLTAGTNENVNDLTANLNALVAGINSVDDSNIAAAAAIQESKLATGVNGLLRGAFRAFRTTAVSLATGAVVVFDAEVGDISSWYDTATGRFTPQVAGWYRFSWCVTMGGLASGNTVVTDLRLNAAAGGEAHGQSATQPAAGVNACSVGSANCPANGTTDFFDILLTHTGTGSQVITTGRASTYFCGELIGRT